MNKETLEKRIDELIDIGTKLTLKFAANEVDQNTLIKVQEIFHGTLDIITILYGQTSIQLKNFIEEEETIRQKYYPNPASEYRNQLSLGILTNMKASLNAGIIGSLQRSITGELLTDFLQLARTVLNEKGDEAKNVASVLAAALFEDTIRRISTLNGMPHIDKLQDVLIELKNKDVLQGSQVGIANSYLNFRNNSLHADWEKIEREAVVSVLGFCEQLLLKETI
jgi:hypothetical protein